MTRTVIATKMISGRLVERKFTEYNWDLIGVDKNGWVLKTEQTVNSDIQLPPKGQVVKAEIKKPEQVMPIISTVAQETKNEFATQASKLSKGVIKDYFDREKIIYSNTANIIDIRTQLGNELNYNIEKLNQIFNDSKK